MSTSEFVRIEKTDRIATVVIDRQDKLNALNPQVISELGSAFDTLRSDDSVRGVVLTGAGDKAFVAGADIGVLAKMDTLSGVRVSREGQRVLKGIERFPKPVVAAVGGYALGGGCELAIACHLRIASQKARFGLPEVTLGIIPGYGGTIRLARLIGLGRALDMTLTGRMVGADEALGMGLVNRVVAPEDLAPEAAKLAGQITRNAPVALQMALESIYGALDTDSEQAEAFESSLFGLLASTDDMQEGMKAFLEKRSAEFEGR